MRQATLLWAILLLASTLPALAQQAPATQPATLAPATTAAPPAAIPVPAVVADHVIAPRDTLHIISWTSAQVVVNTVLTVDNNGTAPLPYLGLTTVAGVTIRDLTASLGETLRKQFPDAVLYIMLEGQKIQSSARINPLLTRDETTSTLSPNLPLLTAPLAAGDQLAIRVWTGELVHLDVTAPVSETLTISLPPIGTFSTRELNLLTLRDALLRRYRLYYPRCSVNVLLTERSGTPVKPEDLLPPTGSTTEVPAWQKLPPEVTATEILTSLPRFGGSIFGAEETTETAPRPTGGLPMANAPVPGDYLLGPGDQLAIRNWSGAVGHHSGEVTVSPEGKIYLPLLGEIAIGGQTLAQATSLITQRFARFFRGSETTVTVVAPRSLEVYVTGDAARPGKHTLSGTATVFTALYAAGGPSAIGSLRQIRLSRKGQPARVIDLYPYLLTGERDQDLPLSPGDTVFIGPSEATIGIAGLVRRPALYEITQGLTIAEALKMAAGLDPRGYAPNIEVWRVDKNTAWNVVNINLNGAKGTQKGPDFPLLTGDLVLVRPVLEKPANTVEAMGAVRRPGIYDVGEGLDVATLLQRAEGLEENAYVAQGAVWRLTPNHDYRLLRFNVRRALDKQQPDNFALKPGDKVTIHSREDVIQPQEVSIAGAVGNPGVYPWAEEMRLSDLLLSARGLLPGAYTTRADLQRVTPDQRQQIIPVTLVKLLSGDPAADLPLQPGDLLTVYAQADMGPASEVVISGNVARPGVYARTDGMKISDLIHQAGGLLPGSGEELEYTKGRTAGTPQVTHLKLQQQGDKFVIEPDVVLGDDDHVAVMGTGGFNVRPQIVTIQGMVAKPGTYAMVASPDQPDTVYKLLERAGMLLPNANSRGIVLYRLADSLADRAQKDDVGQVLKAFNREGAGTQTTLSTNDKANAMSGSLTKQMAQVMGGASGEAVVVVPPRTLSYETWANAVPIEGDTLISTQGKQGDMPLAPGDTVVVPAMPTTVAVIGAVVRPGAVRFQGPKSPPDYILLAGGPAADAVIGRTIVVRANGSVLPFSKARQVQPGDVIVVPSDYMIRQLGGPNAFERLLQTIAVVATAYLIN